MQSHSPAYQYRGIFFILIGLLSIGAIYFGQQKASEWGLSAEYLADIKNYREKAEERLRSESGWLTVVGLHWLKEGEQSVGSAVSSDLQLPSSTPAHLGEIRLREKKVFFKKTTNEDVFILSGDSRQELQDNNWTELKDDSIELPTQIEINDVVFFLIARSGRIGVRVKHQNARTRREFSGRTWFRPAATAIVDAKWTLHDSPQPILVPDILGNQNEELAPGVAEFEWEGQQVQLTPTKSNDELFFVFKDATSGEETYGAARFLYARPNEAGRVILDFNKAINPPCAFTAYATCPLPPKENQLKIAIRAGEKTPKSGH